MKKILAITLTMIMAMMLLTACGSEYDFYTLENGKKTLKVEFDNNKKGYTWKTTIWNLDKLEVASEKNKGGKYVAKINTITKSGKGKKGGGAAVAFTYVNDKDAEDVALGYVVSVSINPTGKINIKRVDEYKVNLETTEKDN